jgi:hypothetical protein
MTFSGFKFSAYLTPKTHDVSDFEIRLVKIEERKVERTGEVLMRTFTGIISASQLTRPKVKELIEQWCEIYRRKLPYDGGKIPINLDEVRM